MPILPPPTNPPIPSASNYPSLEDIALLVRVLLNDFQNAGAGQINTDDSPQLLTAMNSALRWVYRKMRNVGDPTLIRDNVIVTLPANAVTGPNIQTYLGFSGYFDGAVVQPTPALPGDLLYPLELWESQSGSGLPFTRMIQPQFGLPSPFSQTFALGMWEWRSRGQDVPGQQDGGNSIFFVGALNPVDVRIRYVASLTTFAQVFNWVDTFVPLMDCQEAVAYRCAYILGLSLFGLSPAVADLKQNSLDAVDDLKLSVIRRAQTVEYQRNPYDPGWSSSYSWGNTNLL